MNKKMTTKMKALRFVKKHKKNTTRHTLLATFVLLFLLVLLPVGHFLLAQSENSSDYTNNKFTAIFTGDMVFNSYYEKSVEKGRTENISRYLTGYLDTADYTTGNIIGSVTAKETALLRAFNFSIVNIDEETENDIKILAENGITTSGADLKAEQKIVYQEINGMKIATIGTTESHYAGNLKWINQAKLNADLVIVHVNWNDQYDSHVTDNQRSIAKAISDAGADIILGHNTGVLQPIEIFNSSIIIYSLGNFLHGEMYSITNNSALIQYTISPDGSKMFKIVPLSLAYGRPQPALAIFDSFNRNIIFNVLTRELPENMPWTVENGILTVPIN